MDYLSYSFTKTGVLSTVDNEEGKQVADRVYQAWLDDPKYSKIINKMGLSSILRVDSDTYGIDTGKSVPSCQPCKTIEVGVPTVIEVMEAIGRGKQRRQQWQW